MREEVGRSIGLSARKVQVSSKRFLSIRAIFAQSNQRVCFQIWFQASYDRARFPLSTLTFFALRTKVRKHVDLKGRMPHL